VAQAIAGKGIAPGLPVEIWFQDEMRIGQKNGLVYQWAKKGTRPRQPKDQRYANAYVFGAICPVRDLGTALVLPRADASAMQHHLDEISRCVAAVHTPCSPSTRPVGTPRASCRCRLTSAFCTFRPPARS
jgi:DDE superfamily endonuclease